MGDASDQEKDFSVKLKVPEQSWELMVGIAALLRNDPDFFRRLQLFVDEFQRPSLMTSVEKIAERLEKMEQHVTGLAKDMRAVQTKLGSGKVPVWITGQGRGVRLTPQGEDEIDRLFNEGLSDTDIAIRLGLSQAGVFRRRRKFDQAIAGRSPS